MAQHMLHSVLSMDRQAQYGVNIRSSEIAHACMLHVAHDIAPWIVLMASTCSFGSFVLLCVTLLWKPGKTKDTTASHGTHALLTVLALSVSPSAKVFLQKSWVTCVVF